MMSAKRCGLASFPFSVKGPIFAMFLSFTVNGEFYFTGHFSGLPRGLKAIIGPLKWPPLFNELRSHKTLNPKAFYFR